MMQSVKKEAVHVGYGVKMRTKDGRLRIIVPTSKRWRVNPFPIIGIGFILVQLLFDSDNVPASSHWLDTIIITLFLLGVTLIVAYLLWYLLGQYVLEIGDKTVRVGRSLFGYELLGTYDATSLRRLRFSPALNMDNPNGSRGGSWHGAKTYIPGRYNLHLDYGLKQRQVLNMAIEEGQVRIIKEIIRDHCPYPSQSSLKLETTTDISAPAKGGRFSCKQRIMDNG